VPNESGKLPSTKSMFLSTSMLTRKKATPLDVVGEEQELTIHYKSKIVNKTESLGLPGYDRLTDDEKSICSDTRLTPIAFLEYKRIMTNESANAGYLRLSDARRLIKIDVNKTREIYNFLIKNGYINAPLS
jgi:SWIRM domain